MAKRQGGSGFIYASIPLDMTDELHDLENEKPGTVGAMTLAFMDYAKAHAKDTTAPETVPEAQEGFSLAARHVWTRLINTHNGRIGSYISQVEGGKKAQPGPGRPKGSKNRPKEPAQEIPEAAPDDANGVTGMGPWSPSQKEIKDAFSSYVISEYTAGNTPQMQKIASAMALEVWARLTKCSGYLAYNGKAGVDESYLLNDLEIVDKLFPEGDAADFGQEISSKAALLWRYLDTWAALQQQYMDLFDLFQLFKKTQALAQRNTYYFQEHSPEAYSRIGIEPIAEQKFGSLAAMIEALNERERLYRQYWDTHDTQEAAPEPMSQGEGTPK